MARRYDKEDSKRRILSACVKLFIEKGYHNTTLAEILREADVTSSTFQNIFRTKDGVLMDLVEFMFENQFGMARTIAKTSNPVLIYAVETSIQIALAELNENLRDIYIEAYSNSQTIEYIHQHTSTELHKIFGTYLPDYEESDFYELEIGSSGIMCGYMAKRCDKYFTLEKKIQRFLAMSMTVYAVSDDEQQQILSYISSLDIRHIANQVMQKLFIALAMKFDFTFNTEWRK